MQLKKLFSLLRKVDWDVKLGIKQLLLQRKDVLLGIHLQVVLKARREKQEETTSASSYQVSEPGN